MGTTKGIASQGTIDRHSLAEPRVDLTNCDREPIRVPGSVQAHGFLLGLERQNHGVFAVSVASENAADFLGRELSSILSATLDDLLPSATVRELNEQDWSTKLPRDATAFLGTVMLGASEEQQCFQIIGSRIGELSVLEFERLDAAMSERELNSAIANFVSALEKLHSPQDLCRAVTVQIRRLTGFDRVMLYQFDEEGHGTVLAEDRNDRLPSYLGQRFPASDIPRQARELYVLNRVRIIPNVEYEPSPLVAREGTVDPASLDLSLSVLRSVSPVHRDYMRNMGTISSMSVSIVSEGKLWGLISGHHSEAKTVPYLVRLACDVLSRIMTTQLMATQRATDLSHAIRLKSVHTQLLTYMAAGENYIDGLTTHAEELCALTGANGAAIIVGEHAIRVGDCPTAEQVLHIATLLGRRLREDVFVTNQIGSVIDVSEEIERKASGVLAISLSQIHRMQVLWFRPEVLESIEWAGEPEKDQRMVEGVLQIHPRNSFASWKQIVRGRSERWSAVEIESARDFRSAVLEIVLKKAEELAGLVSELEVSNKELEAFSYSVSHDLRAPFRHISGFAELIMEEEADRLTEKGRKYLSTIAESAQYAGLLVDSLLNFSRLSRQPLEKKPFPMRVLVEDVWRDVVKQELKGREVQFSVTDLPVVTADINLMRQVWRNLLSNAAKYTRQREHATVHVSAETSGDEVIFSVTDNGVGFDNRYAHKLFGVFQRLHRMEDFEGTGIGLANVRRIVGRMGGRTWATGVPDEGATFFFSLPLSASLAGKAS